MTAVQGESILSAEMVRTQIECRGITDPAVLAAMRQVARHLFVPAHLRSSAYEDHPLTIGEGQTISQPYIVALMTECLALSDSDIVLEIGTGSGYQAAVLSRIVRQVFTIEVREVLFRRARRVLSALGCANIEIRHGDGYYGWPERAPFDGIIITAAVGLAPPPLLAQLKEGGRLVLPFGTPPGHQRLTVITRVGMRFQVRHITGVTFVPMVGRATRREDR